MREVCAAVDEAPDLASAVVGAVTAVSQGLRSNTAFAYLLQHEPHAAHRVAEQVILVQRREEMLVLQALRELPLEQQTALELNLLENLSGREISELLGVAEGTVRSRLRLGLDRLRRRVAELAATPDELESTLSDLAAWARNIRAVIDGAPA